MAKAKILMVDDNPDILELMASRLEGNGYEIITALNGDEAIKKAKSDNPGLVLLDITMPVIDGFEVGRLLKANPGTKSIPIIMVTARSSQKDVSTALIEVGAADYIIKPFRPEELLDKIEKVLKRYKKNVKADRSVDDGANP